MSLGVGDSAGAPPPAPYLVSFDVSRAFDSVNVSRLLDLVEPLLRQREYLLVKYVEVRVSSRATALRTDAIERRAAARCEGLGHTCCWRMAKALEMRGTAGAMPSESRCSAAVHLLLDGMMQLACDSAVLARQWPAYFPSLERGELCITWRSTRRQQPATHMAVPPDAAVAPPQQRK